MLSFRGTPRPIGGVFLRLVHHKPLETVTCLAFWLWFIYLIAPWNPWAQGSTAADAMDSAMPHWMWLMVTGMGTVIKTAGIATQDVQTRQAGAIIGFSFWTFIAVTIFRAAPYSLLLVQFIVAATSSAIIFWSLAIEGKGGDRYDAGG